MSDQKAIEPFSKEDHDKALPKSFRQKRSLLLGVGSALDLRRL
jgi:hypothetical protein